MRALAAWLAGVAIGYAVPSLDPLARSPRPTPTMWLSVAVVGAASATLLAVFGRVRSAGLFVAVTVLCLGLARGVAAVHLPGPGTVDGYLGDTIRVEGSVDSVSAPVSGAGGSTASQQQSFRLSATRIRSGGAPHMIDGLVLVQSRGQAEVWPGQLVSLAGRLNRVRRLGPGGSAGYGDRLEREGIQAEMTATSLLPLTPPPRLSLARVVDTTRRQLVRSCRDLLPEPEATIVLGEVAGIRGRLPSAVDADLVDSGLVHVLAISGIKVAIIAGLLQLLTVAVAGRRAAVAAVGGVGLYTLVGGASASALRSAFMGSLGLLGRTLRRDTEVLRSLSLAAGIMLAWRPSLVLDLSFQYSFLGVLGIHLFAERFSRRLWRLPRVLRESLAVTAAAQLATLPLTAHYFQVIPVLAPLANALVLPTLPLVITAGVLMGLADAAARGMASTIPPVAALAVVVEVPLAEVLFWLARLAIVVSHAAASVPGGVLRVASFEAWSSAAYFAGVGAFVTARSRWRLPVAAGLAALVATTIAVGLARPDGRLHVRFLAAGSGPAALVVAPDGATLLIDTGSQAAALGRELDATLPARLPLPRWRGIDSVVLSGGSRPEAGGLAALDRYRIGMVFAADDMITTAAVEWLGREQRLGATMTGIRPGDSWTWHGLGLSVAASKTESVAVVVGYGDQRIAIVDAGTGAPAVVPPGQYAVVDVGDGAVEPTFDGVGTRLLLAQDTVGKPIARSLRVGFSRELWQASHDGRLEITCDPRRCAW
jgi:ComEC/Rec2-related protein